ncbi:MAG: hypothetical protein LBD41_05960 [Clostridiales Family XIII bacterium]|nr:hypothetical protein [Clostridiales Family XIII bacterium]
MQKTNFILVLITLATDRIKYKRRIKFTSKNFSESLREKISIRFKIVSDEISESKIIKSFGITTLICSDLMSNEIKTA